MRDRVLVAAAALALCSSASDIASATPLYEKPPQPFDGCGELFSLVLCRDFDFVLQSEVAAGLEQDRLIVRPTPDYHSRGLATDACTVAALIRETEALLNSRFMELHFEGITIRGTLHLSEIDPRARLSFFEVNFVPPPVVNDADPDPPPADRDEQLEPPECLRTEPLEPTFVGSSVVIERSHFRDRVRFERALFEGSVIISGSTFDSNFDIVESDVGGDLVFESSKFASNLELGRDTILRGQIIVDGVRVGGDMAIDGIDVIDTYLDPQELETLAAAPDATLALASMCICAHRDGSFNVDLDRNNLDSETAAPSREIVEETSCRHLLNLPRCPRSNGFDPVLIEISHTDVAGMFSLTDLALGSSEVGFRPFKSSDGRFASLNERKTCSFSFIPDEPSPREPPPAKCESSLSRLESPEILIDDVSVSGAALLRSNQSKALYINNSSIQRLASEENEFHSLVIARNEFGAFSSANDKLYRGLWVTRNNVGGSMVLDSLVLSDEFIRKQEETSKLVVSVTHNFVGRDLAFTPHGLSDGAIDEVDLSTNRVGGELAVSLPVAEASATGSPLAWGGLIRLRSLDVDGTLAIRFAVPRAKDGRMIVDRSVLAKEGVSCKARAGARGLVHFDLANSIVKNVVWGVPLQRPERCAADCVTWEGVGLRYDNWEADSGWGDLSQENKAEDSSARGSGPLPELLGHWRGLYARAGLEAPAGKPPPDPLHHMADYLGKMGEQKASREVRADAKRAGFPLPGGDNWTTAGNAIAWIIFLPTDFGTKPEWAFLALAGFMLLAWATYTLCRWYYRSRWPDLRKSRDIVVAREQMREAMGQHLAGRALDRDGDDLHVTEDRLGELLDLYGPMAVTPHMGDVEIRHISAVPGFMQYDRNRQPQDFMIWRYALDTMIPVIDLHAYNQYYPKPKWLRTFAMFQHLVGWWVLTSFVASLAVL